LNNSLFNIKRFLHYKAIIHIVEKLSDNKILRIITVIFAALFLISSFFLFSSIVTIKNQEKTINNFDSILADQKQKTTQCELVNQNLSQNLSRKEALLNNQNLTLQKREQDIINLTMVSKIDYGVLAVDQNDNGYLIPLEVIIKEGKGSLFLNVANVLFDETLQSSANTAVKVAREVSRKDLASKDILINIKSPAQEQTITIQGGSAGGAMTLAAMAAIQGKTLRTDVLITGTINDDHTIGRIGAPKAKAIAAKENGAVMFLVPAGQKSEVGDVGIEVREVSTIEDAAKLAIV
jgi:hypothetical protein